MAEVAAPTARVDSHDDVHDDVADDDDPLVEADLLVEDVSIDGMCGVY